MNPSSAHLLAATLESIARGANVPPVDRHVAGVVLGLYRKYLERAQDELPRLREDLEEGDAVRRLCAHVPVLGDPETWFALEGDELAARVCLVQALSKAPMRLLFQGNPADECQRAVDSLLERIEQTVRAVRATWN